MSFSYDPSLAEWRDHVRLALADTDSASPLLQDETIDAKLSEFGYLEGLAQLADGLAVLVAQDPTRYGEGSAGLVAEWNDRVASLRNLAADCRSGRVASPLGGLARPGTSVSVLSAPDGVGFRSD